MKKIILSAAAIFAFSLVSAQEIKTDAGTFTKPTAGTYIIEANMTPDITGGGIFALPSVSGDIIGIKARKFSSESKALRLGANLSMVNTGVEGEDTEFTLAASAGIEHHMKGAERLSTYWGYEGNVGYVSSNGAAGEEDIDGNIIGGEPKQTKLGIGANVFTGFDYYIMPKIYLGAEVSYGLAITSTTPDGGEGVTRMELAPSITPTFRIGWQF